MADPSLPVPRTPIEGWTVVRDELTAAHLHLERAREMMTQWFLAQPVALWRRPFFHGDGGNKQE